MINCIQGSIKTYLNPEKPWPEIKIAKQAKHILEALKHLHDNNIFHGNVNSNFGYKFEILIDFADIFQHRIS